MRIFGKKGVLGLLVATLLLVPGLVHAKGKGAEVYKKYKEKVIKELKLSPEKAKKLEQLDDQYREARIAILKNLKKDGEALKKVLAAKKPDESKVKELVSKINSLEDKLIMSFKSQREGELALLTPIQQGKYLLGVGPLAP
jgi:Spy/CpxP family protein refolding chaperone